jgi:pyruvate-formate lyase
LDNGDGDIREKEGELKKLAIEYRNDEDIKKLQTKFYMKTNNYDAAKAVAKSLVKKDDSIENKILLTDIYAEEARRSLNSIDSSFDTDFEAGEKDKEIAAINKEIKASYERLELIDNMEEDVKDEDKKLQLQKLREKERMTLTELSNKKAVVSVKRSINYLMASQNL